MQEINCPVCGESFSVELEDKKEELLVKCPECDSLLEVVDGNPERIAVLEYEHFDGDDDEFEEYDDDDE